jgi:sialate O-acetylesterase
MQVASVFQDHMVLQRERPLPVWGKATPGQTVTVTLARDITATTRTGADGRWQVSLPAQTAGGPFTLHVSGGGPDVTFHDVWVGEVWIASGQSNMEMTLGTCLNAGDEIAAADFPGIRVLTAARVALTTRQETLAAGTWKVCEPRSAGAFTGVGYFFARELHQKLGVAVGIIDSSWGGTVAEAWTSRQGLQADPSLKHHVDKLDRFLSPAGALEREAVQKARAAWEASIPQDPGNAGVERNWHQPAFRDADWPVMTLPTRWQTEGHDFSGVFWFRREFEVPAAWAGKDLALNLGACDKRDYTYFNGEFLGSLGMEDRPDAWCTPRVYTIPAKLVKAGRNVIAVRVFSNMYHGGMIGPAEEMWVGPADAAPPSRLALAGAWRYFVERDFGQVNTDAPPQLSYGDGNPNTPTVLFNSMIAPLVPYALRGFIWYQGESNADRAGEYRSLFPALIRDWRREWGRDDLAFHFVQLANFWASAETPTESDWAHLREAQRFTLSVVPHTGMAVIIDIGDAADIHPKNKQDVGRRLAACALAGDYGRPEFVGSSPLPRAAWACDGTVTVKFDHAASGLEVRGGKLQGFALAGADRIFFWADGAIQRTDTVVLSSREVPAPKWVRYAWANNPVCNLYGGTGLPASPFELALPGGTWMMES